MDYTLDINGNILTIIPSGALTTNREFKITLSPEISGYIPPSGDIETLGTQYQFWFTSTYCPLFTTVGRVKLLAGPEAETLLDDTIYRMIHKNSLDVVELYNMSYGTSYPYDYWGCDWQTVPLQMKRYVECKTAWDVLNFARIAAMGGSSGGPNQTKTLGDITIKYGGAGGGSTAGTGPDPNKLKDLYDCWNESMRMIRALRVAVKAYYDESKGFAHPVREIHHNRVVRPVNFTNSHPRGPWMPSHDWVGYYYPHDRYRRTI